MHFYSKCWFDLFKEQIISLIFECWPKLFRATQMELVFCPSLMLGIAIRCIQHSQTMLERGVCEVAHSFFHYNITFDFCCLVVNLATVCAQPKLRVPFWWFDLCCLRIVNIHPVRSYIKYLINLIMGFYWHCT